MADGATADGTTGAMVGTTGKSQSVSQRRFNAVNEDAMTRSKLFALATLLAATMLSAPAAPQQPPPAAGARPPAATPPAPAGQQPQAGPQPGQQPQGGQQQGAQQAGGPPQPEGIEGPPWPVLVVTSVETLRSHIKGHLEIIRVRGLVTSDGWGDQHRLP